MAHPRRVTPGTTYLVTRRAYQRTYRLRPSALTAQIAEYCVAWAAAKTGVVLHAIVVMSNHHHLVVSDPRGVLPNFLREFHRTMAKALNAAQKQRENLWSTEKASAVRLPTARDVLDKIAYCAANPVAAALVRAPDEWPGVNLWRPGTRKTVSRPRVYFDPEGSMPPEVELRLEPISEQHDSRAWHERVKEAVATRVEEARASVTKQGLEPLGARAVAKTPFLARATSREERRRADPVLAARDGSLRRALLGVEKAFRSAYRSALAGWKTGDREVAFPFGTWWMSTHHAAHVTGYSGLSSAAA